MPGREDAVRGGSGSSASSTVRVTSLSDPLTDEQEAILARASEWIGSTITVVEAVLTVNHSSLQALRDACPEGTTGLVAGIVSSVPYIIRCPDGEELVGSEAVRIRSGHVIGVRTGDVMQWDGSAWVMTSLSFLGSSGTAFLNNVVFYDTDSYGYYVGDGSDGNWIVERIQWSDFMRTRHQSSASVNKPDTVTELQALTYS